MSQRSTLPDQCPNCGAELEPGARVCPECGSDETTGWSEAARQGQLGLPDDSFDYDEFVKREFESSPARKSGLRWFWALIAALVLGAMVWLALH